MNNKDPEGFLSADKITYNQSIKQAETTQEIFQRCNIFCIFYKNYLESIYFKVPQYFAEH